MSTKVMVVALTLAIAMATAPDAEARSLRKIARDVTRAPAKVAKKVLPAPVAKVAVAVLEVPEKTVAEAERVGEKGAKEVKNGIENVGEAVVTAGKFAEDEFKNAIETHEAFSKALLHGRIDEATEALTVDHWRRSEDNLAEAVIESSLLRVLAQTAATAYGAGAGGAAFSGWYAYHASGGDWDTALRSGATSYATSYVVGQVQGVSVSDNALVDASARSVATGVAVAGVTAVNGGDSEAIKDAFVLGTASGVAREVYTATMDRDPDMRGATEDAIAKTCESVDSCDIPEGAKYHFDENDNVIIETKSLPQNIAVVGKAIGLKPTDWQSENSAFMTFLAKDVSGMNAMGFFHDTWMEAANVQSDFALMSTIPPAIVMTYLASGAPQELAAVEQVIDSKH